jgi:hypothetical protein
LPSIVAGFGSSLLRVMPLALQVIVIRRVAACVGITDVATGELTRFIEQLEPRLPGADCSPSPHRWSSVHDE